jgi:hypothetical protein
MVMILLAVAGLILAAVLILLGMPAEALLPAIFVNGLALLVCLLPDVRDFFNLS